MTRLILIFALFLSGCAPRLEPVIYVPNELTNPVIVTCSGGETVRALGSCAIRLRQGLDEANIKLRSIRELVARNEE